MTSRRPTHVAFVMGLAIPALLIGPAALALVWTPTDPLTMAIGGRLEGPSSGHPFGTDQYGRDVLARVMTGAVTTIAVGLLALAVGAGIGGPLGVVGGCVGGWLGDAVTPL